jgi:hypothetical protein
MYLVAKTKYAFGFSEDNGRDVDLWLPDSQTQGFTRDFGDVKTSEVEIGDYVTHAQIPCWIAEEKDLAYED